MSRVLGRYLKIPSSRDEAVVKSSSKVNYQMHGANDGGAVTSKIERKLKCGNEL